MKKNVLMFVFVFLFYLSVVSASECNDGVDSDADALADYYGICDVAAPGVTIDCSTYSSAQECWSACEAEASAVYTPADDDCSSFEDDSEYTVESSETVYECNDGEDNDGDALADYYGACDVAAPGVTIDCSTYSSAQECWSACEAEASAVYTPADTGCSSFDDNDEISCVDSDCGAYVCLSYEDSCYTFCFYGYSGNDHCAEGYACSPEDTCSEDSDGDGEPDISDWCVDSDCGAYICDASVNDCYSSCTRKGSECASGYACTKGICNKSLLSFSKSKPKGAAEYDSSSYLPWVLGGVGVLLIGGILYWHFKPVKKKGKKK